MQSTLFPPPINQPELQAGYVYSMREKHAEITTCWLIAQQNHWKGESIDKLRQVIHRLIGSSISHGFMDIASTARLVKSDLAQQPITAEKISELQHRLQLLCSLLTIYSQTDHHYDTTQTDQHYKTWTHTMQGNIPILLIDKNITQANHLSEQLGYSGYQVSICTTLATLKEYAHTQKPLVILLDSLSPPETKAELQEIEIFIKKQWTNTPLIFLSPLSSLQARLHATQLNATAFLTKPVIIPQLTTHLNELTNQKHAEPYRVLIVEDDTELATLYQTLLEEEGMEIMQLDNIEKLSEIMVEFKPELILLDIHLNSEYNGFNLAALIRQEDAYIHIPIVFLTADSTPHCDLMALGSGGDDYLTKPVSLDFLTELIKVRIRRARKLTKLIAYDAMTGFLNRKAFITQLKANIATAERSGSPIALALIDIDNLHYINQNYGYWMGDHVLKQVSRILKQRLRRGDLIGRYYGDGFIIALNDADIISAQRVLEALLEDIGSTEWEGEDKFFITLSVGIAYYPGHMDGFERPDAGIFGTVEKALRTAKSKGRNQVAVISLSQPLPL